MAKPQSTIHNLEFARLHSLLNSVFALKENERGLTIFVDLPDSRVKDNAEWVDRRRIAAEWYSTLLENLKSLPFESLLLCTYENVGTNNNDLPESLTVAAESSGKNAWTGDKVSLEKILEATSIILAPTELSATAPLKNLAKRFPLRGATLPGFSRRMIPALSLNYEKVHERVMQFKSRLDKATSATIRLDAEGTLHKLVLDLRYRSAHASSGLMRENGIVANLPSGEAYIVPYEGERPREPSRTTGFLPVQFGAETVVYRLEANKAVEVVSNGMISKQESLKLLYEPAYGNIAELGLGVLGEWGVEAIGSILLDEKLGLHVAFGRSDHFGGVTGPSAFHDQANVIHIDRIYVPSCQPGIGVEEVALTYDGGGQEAIMKGGKYCV